MTKKLPTIFDPQTLSLDVCADFLHVRCILGDDVLVRYGSPHFEPSRARGDLPEHVARVSKPVRHLSEVRFSRPQLIAANEAFPEAAVADPIADLELWEEWNRGTRTFPYPGRYCRLGISTQEGKTTSPSSVGVLGEIMAGLFAQAGISPWVIVRVVRRWPDFIFYTPHDQGRHAFVEAKAFTTAPEGSPELFRRVHSNLLGEVAHQAVLQLNADPFVKVWGAFTHIASISPMKLRVTFIEFDCGDARRAGAVHRALPHAVVEGLATRALWQAASKMRDEELEELRSKSGRRSGGRFEAERRLTQIATEELKNLLLPGSGPVEVVQNSLEDLQREIETQAQSATYASDAEGKRFFAARAEASRGREVPVRTVGTKVVLTRDLHRVERDGLELHPRLDWSSANLPFVGEDGRESWRCGGALFYVVDGDVVSERSLPPLPGRGGALTTSSLFPGGDDTA